MTFPADVTITICGPNFTHEQKKCLFGTIENVSTIKSDYHELAIKISSHTDLAKKLTLRSSRQEFIQLHNLVGIRWEEGHKGTGGIGTARIWAKSSEILSALLNEINPYITFSNEHESSINEPGHASPISQLSQLSSQSSNLSANLQPNQPSTFSQTFESPINEILNKSLTRSSSSPSASDLLSFNIDDPGIYTIQSAPLFPTVLSTLEASKLLTVNKNISHDMAIPSHPMKDDKCDSTFLSVQILANDETNAGFMNTNRSGLTSAFDLGDFQQGLNFLSCSLNDTKTLTTQSSDSSSQDQGLHNSFIDESLFSSMNDVSVTDASSLYSNSRLHEKKQHSDIFASLHDDLSKNNFQCEVSIDNQLSFLEPNVENYFDLYKENFVSLGDLFNRDSLYNMQISNEAFNSSAVNNLDSSIGDALLMDSAQNPVQIAQELDSSDVAVNLLKESTANNDNMSGNLIDSVLAMRVPNELSTFGLSQSQVSTVKSDRIIQFLHPAMQFMIMADPLKHWLDNIISEAKLLYDVDISLPCASLSGINSDSESNDASSFGQVSLSSDVPASTAHSSEILHYLNLSGNMPIILEEIKSKIMIFFQRISYEICSAQVVLSKLQNSFLTQNEELLIQQLGVQIVNSPVAEDLNDTLCTYDLRFMSYLNNVTESTNNLRVSKTLNKLVESYCKNDDFEKIGETSVSTELISVNLWSKNYPNIVKIRILKHSVNAKVDWISKIDGFIYILNDDNIITTVPNVNTNSMKTSVRSSMLVGLSGYSYHTSQYHDGTPFQHQDVIESVNNTTNQSILQIKPDFSIECTKQAQVTSFMTALNKALAHANISHSNISKLGIISPISLASSYSLLSADTIRSLTIETTIGYVIRSQCCYFTDIIFFDEFKIDSVATVDNNSKSDLVKGNVYQVDDLLSSKSSIKSFVQNDATTALLPAYGNRISLTLLVLMEKYANDTDSIGGLEIVSCNFPLPYNIQFENVSKPFPHYLNLGCEVLLVRGLPENIVSVLEHLFCFLRK